MANPIITDFWAKPVPERSRDWTAYRDPEKEIGYGSTELAAIADLLDQEEENR